jgi:hypothetical protein
VTLKKKLRIAALLGAGGIATGASVIRLILVFQPDSFDNETLSFVRFNLLGVAEVGIGIICVCLPAFNIFFTRWATKKRAQRSERSKYNSTTKLSQLQSSSKQSSAARSKSERSTTRSVGVGASESNADGRHVERARYVEIADPQEDLVLQLER